MAVKPIPDGFHTVTPYLIVSDAHGVIEFMQKAFGAELMFPPMCRPDGGVMHAELQVGTSRVMLAQGCGEFPPMPAMLHLYVEDVDATYQRAVAAGGVSVREPENQFYGDRSGGVKDVSGNQWFISSHVEDVSREEMEKRAEAYNAKQTTS